MKSDTQPKEKTIHNCKMLRLLLCILLAGPIWLGATSAAFAQPSATVIPYGSDISWGTSADGSYGNQNPAVCGSELGRDVIKLANNSATPENNTVVYIDKQNGRLVQITNASNSPFTVGGMCDNTGLLQDLEVKNPHWSNCDHTNLQVNPPFDVCSIIAFIQEETAATVTYGVSPWPANTPYVSVSNIPWRYEDGFGDTTYDNVSLSAFSFSVNFLLQPDGVLWIDFTVRNTTSQCFSPWISFPFALVSPFSAGTGGLGGSDWAFLPGGTAGPGNENWLVRPADIGSDVYVVNDARGSSDPGDTNGQAWYHQSAENYYAFPTCNNRITVPVPPPATQGVTGSYSTVKGIIGNYNFSSYDFRTAGYLGLFHLNGSDTADRGILTNIPTGSHQIVMFVKKFNNPAGGLYQLFVESKFGFQPSGSSGDTYQGRITMVPWGGGTGTKSFSAAGTALNNYQSYNTISYVSGSSTACMVCDIP